MEIQQDKHVEQLRQLHFVVHYLTSGIGMSLCTRYTLVQGGTSAKILATKSTRTSGGYDLYLTDEKENLPRILKIAHQPLFRV